MIKWIEKICSEVYKYLDDGLKDGTISDLHRLTSQSCVWTGECFVPPDVVARKWSHKGPYLFSVPYTMRYKSDVNFRAVDNLVVCCKEEKAFVTVWDWFKTTSKFVATLDSTCLIGLEVFTMKDH